MVNWVFTRKLQKSFFAVRLLDAPPPPKDDPLIVFMNHPSWNDPMIISFLTHLFFPEREAYGPIHAEALQGYGFLARTGLYPVDASSPASTRQFLRTSAAILDRKGTVLWITAQGKFSDVRERPVRFEPGLGAVLHGWSSGVAAFPLAVEYAFGEEAFPEVFVSFGPRVKAPNPEGVNDWTAVCEKALQEAQDRLAGAVIERDLSQFKTILGGASGVGGAYGWWQRLKCALQGRSFDSRHASLTSPSRHDSAESD